jgi:branched-chain amino acid transport system permease protein
MSHLTTASAAREFRKPRHFLPQSVFIFSLVILPFFIPSYYQGIATKILIFAIFAASLDILYGYTGLFSMGHSVYFGVGGYTAGLLMTRLGIDSFWIEAPLSLVMAGFVAAVFGVIALRVKGIYFLLVTFALGELMVSLATSWKILSTDPKSTEGILGINYPNLGLPVEWDNIRYYYFVLIVFIICGGLIQSFIKSPFGLSLQGIRQAEARMLALGYNTWLTKLIAFVVAGMFAGLAGVLIAYYDGFMVPADFGVVNSTLALVMVIIGGAGTIYGALVGAAFITVVEQFASSFMPERWPLILGAAFVLTVMFARGGIWPAFLRLIRRDKPAYGSSEG